jgi:hypothetical protein
VPAIRGWAWFAGIVNPEFIRVENQRQKLRASGEIRRGSGQGSKAPRCPASQRSSALRAMPQCRGVGQVEAVLSTRRRGVLRYDVPAWLMEMAPFAREVAWSACMPVFYFANLDKFRDWGEEALVDIYRASEALDYVKANAPAYTRCDCSSHRRRAIRQAVTRNRSGLEASL